MIYEDVYQFLMKKSSAKEFDIILNLIRNTDWNSKINIDMNQLAKRSGTTTRYVKEVFKKFTSLKKGKLILSKITSSDKKEYKLLLGKSSLLYQKGDRYCKKFAFFYTDSFQQLSIYSKRILLEAAMQMSNNNSNLTYISVDDFIFKNEISSGLIPNKKALLSSLDEINSFFNGSIYTSLASTTFNRKETIRIEMIPSMLENTIHNHTEKRILRESLFEYGFFLHLADEHCIELVKTGKYIFNSFIRLAKEEQQQKELSIGLIDEAMDIARYVYQASIKKLAKYLTSNNFIDKDPSEVSAYFSSVAFSVISEELTRRKHKANSIRTLFNNFIDRIKKSELEPIKERYTQSEMIANVLERWCEEWIHSRVSKNKDTDKEVDESINKNYKLKEYINQVFFSIENKINSFCSFASKKDSLTFIDSFRLTVNNFLDIQNERLNEKFFVAL